MNESTIDTIKTNEIPDFRFEQYLDYKKTIEEYSRNDDACLFLNESCIHAAMVTKEMLDRATNKNIDIDMFCGSFSLFREGFKSSVEKIKMKMQGEIMKEQKRDFDRFDPYRDLIESLKNFFSKDLHLDVIIAKPLENIQNDYNCGFFKEKINQGLLSFRLLDIDLDIDHFMVSGDAFRKENSDKERTATCSFNMPEYADLFRRTFKNLKSYSSVFSF